MTSIKLKYRPFSAKSADGAIYFQVIHRRVVRRIVLDYNIHASEWNGIAICAPTDDIQRRVYVLGVCEHVKSSRKLLYKVVSSFKARDSGYSADDIVREFYRQCGEHSFFNFMNAVIKSLGSLQRHRTKQTYESALKSFINYRCGDDVLLEGFNSDLLMGYEAWLKSRGVSMNTVSFYMRILRAVYNRAVEKGLIDQQHPFRHVYTGVAKTIKRAIPFSSIKKLKALDLRNDRPADFARDMFLFSFYMRGMSFVDMSFLRKNNLKNGVLTYYRHKTGQLLQIKWEKNMQEIIDKYNTAGSPYLLPIIKTHGSDERRQYENALHSVNRKLKKLAAMTGLSVNLTMYVGRHSWASIAQSMNIPIAVISSGMGHNSVNTTQIYLSAIDTSAVDKANELILKGL